MFTKTKKYKNRGHFFFKKEPLLSEVTKGAPELPSVYYVLRLAKGKVDLVYIGKSGTINQSGIFKSLLLLA